MEIKLKDSDSVKVILNKKGCEAWNNYAQASGLKEVIPSDYVPLNLKFKDFRIAFAKEKMSECFLGGYVST